MKIIVPAEILRYKVSNVQASSTERLEGGFHPNYYCSTHEYALMLLWSRLYHCDIHHWRTNSCYFPGQRRLPIESDQSYERDPFKLVHYRRITLPRFFIVNITSTILLRAASECTARCDPVSFLIASNPKIIWLLKLENGGNRVRSKILWISED